MAGLEGEFARWNSEVESMSGDLEKIPQFSLLGSAFLVYLSNAPEDERKRAMEKWQAALGIKKFDLNHFLASEREILQWRSEGLPSDNLSVENAMCILQSLARDAIQRCRDIHMRFHNTVQGDSGGLVPWLG